VVAKPESYRANLIRCKVNNVSKRRIRGRIATYEANLARVETESRARTEMGSIRT